MENNFGRTGFVYNNDFEWENVGDGVRRKIMGYDKDLMMVIVEFKKDAIGYVHKHVHKQVTYVAKGAFEVNINGEKKVLKAGDCFLIPSDIEHGVVALEEGALIDIFNPHREDFVQQK